MRMENFNIKASTFKKSLWLERIDKDRSTNHASSLMRVCRLNATLHMFQICSYFYEIVPALTQGLEDPTAGVSEAESSCFFRLVK